MTDWIFENDTALKILAVLVAVAVWLQVNLSTPQPVERQIPNVPVAWLLPNHSRLTVTVPPGSVTIKIKGSPSAVASNAAEAWVNLTKITKPGTYSLPVLASVPSGTSLVGVTPAAVTVTVEEEISRTFPVRLVPSGSPVAGFGVLAMQMVGHDATVSGPSNLVDKVHAVVARVPLSGQNASFSTTVRLVPVTATGAPVRNLDVLPAVRTVNVSISPTKVLPVTVTYAGNPASGLTVTSIQVSPNRVTVFGNAAALASLTTIDTNRVNIAGTTSSVTTQATLNLPSGVTMAQPNTVVVTINVGP
jgi:YbbR domain-containing protein